MMHFHHVGCAVKSIAAALPAYRPFFPNIGEPILVTSQKVRVCFIEMRPGFYLELVEPAAEPGDADGAAVNAFLRKGITYYHNGFLVDDFDAVARDLISQGAKPLPVFHSEAFGGRRCQFFLNTAFHLIEIVEADSIEGAP
jgi:hypothetical protein